MRQVFMRLSPPLPSLLLPLPLPLFYSPLYCFVFLACLLFYIIYPFAREVVGLLKFGLSARQNWANFAASLGKQLRKSLSQCLIGEQS